MENTRVEMLRTQKVGEKRLSPHAEAHVHDRLVALMQRDQRTTRTFDRTRVRPSWRGDFNGGIDRRLPGTADADVAASKVQSAGHREHDRKNSYLKKSLQKLKHSLLLFTCLLSVVNIPHTATAPMEKRAATCNNCNSCEYFTVEPQQAVGASGLDLSKVEGQANIGLNKALKFRSEYCKTRNNFDVEASSNLSYNWFSNINDLLTKEETTKQTVMVRDFLTEAHGELQKYYNVLKLISENATARGDEVAKDFGDTVGFLLSTLTEMRELMSAEEIPTDEVDYKEIPANIFANDRTTRKIRDWVVLRDYTNYLLYFLRVLRHLDANSS